MSWQLSFWATLSLGFAMALCLWPWLPRRIPIGLRLRAASLPVAMMILIGVSLLFRDSPSVILAFASVLPLLASAELLSFRCQPLSTDIRAWQGGIAILLLLTLATLFLDIRRAFLLAGFLQTIGFIVLASWMHAKGVMGRANARFYVLGLFLVMTSGLAVLTGSRIGWDSLHFSGLALCCLAAITLLWAIEMEEYREPAPVLNGNSGGRDETTEQQQLFMSISHDMRTPLSGILGMTELLLETPLTPVQREYAQTVQSSGNALLHVLNDRLEVANQSAQSPTILEEVFDLSELLGYCLDLFKTHADEKQLELIGYLDTALPRQVMGDVVHLRQILSRLIHNALRFTDIGEVVVSIKSSLLDQDLGLQFSVQDTGMGMDAEHLAALFEPGNSIRTSNVWHIGPDLATCRQLITAMGGKLSVESTPHQGSTLGFTLPLKSASGSGSDTTTEFIATFSSKRLLVVDDNRTVSRVLAEQATQWGMRVSTAESGTEALAVARNAANLGQPFDVIIMDYQMPGMSGLQLGARLKEDPLITNDVILVMLTGLRHNNIHTLARNAGIHRVISKPVTSRQLRQVISQELRRMDGIQQPETNGDVAMRLGRLKVLIAEDNQLSQKVIRGMMQKLGVESTLVSNGREAVQAVMRDHYDLVLMDCDMPYVDGYAATQEIRNWERQQQRKALPILALTAHILEEQKQKAYRAGMNEHLSKPIELCDLQNALIRWSKD
ncbi:MAG TPA: response regulator [Fluviicoccus sp.]|nr:response regulator [Fluviicoccus sp.]